MAPGIPSELPARCPLTSMRIECPPRPVRTWVGHRARANASFSLSNGGDTSPARGRLVMG
jgi:hypothetical protein